MSQKRQRPPRFRGVPPPRDPPPGGRPRSSPLALMAMGLGIYVLTLWFGITVVGDTAFHSALMGFLILALAGAAYLTAGRTPPSGPGR